MLGTLGDEVERRAARLNLTLGELAERMGIMPQALSELFRVPHISEASFLRLTVALEMVPEDWDRPLPRSRTPLEKARAWRRAVRQMRTEKTEPTKIADGESGPVLPD